MKIFLIITFVIAALLCTSSAILVFKLGFKRRRLNRPYHIEEYQKFVKAEKPTNAKLSLSDKFKSSTPKEVVVSKTSMSKTTVSKELISKKPVSKTKINKPSNAKLSLNAKFKKPVSKTKVEKHEK